MYKITAIIEKGSDGMYSVRSEQHFGNNYFGGFGETVAIAKEDFLESVKESGEFAIAAREDVPEDYQVMFCYDLPSFFEDFDFINVSRFARCAGIVVEERCGIPWGKDHKEDSRNYTQNRCRTKFGFAITKNF